MDGAIDDGVDKAIDGAMLARIEGDPRYRRLVRRRARLAWALSAVMVAAYMGFILLVAFARHVLARPIGGGVTPLGVPVGFGLILLAIALTAVYVRRANRDHDALAGAIRADAGA